MKKILILTACLCSTAFAVQAQLVDDNFETYGNVDLNGQGDWIAQTSAFMVTNNEVFLSVDNRDLILTNNGIDMEPGDTLSATVDFRVHMPPPEGSVNFSLFNVGFQATDVLAEGGVANTIMGRIYYNNYANGALKFKPDDDQWWLASPEIRADAYDDCGFDHKPSQGVVDPDSDMLRVIYTMTKSDVINEFTSSITFVNIATNVPETVSKDVITRANVWASSNVTFRVHSLDNANGPNETYLDSITVELTPPSAAPDAISALGLDTKVDLTWTKMVGAAEYDLYKGTTPGVYGAPIRVVGNTYEDTAVLNGTPYYYAVEAVYYNGNSDKSPETSATPAGVFINQPLITTDFSGYALDDLAGQNGWEAISGSGSNAFAVIQDGLMNTADTVATMADFNTTNGNAVYVDQLVGNGMDDAIEGYIDVIISTTSSVGTPDDSVLNPAEFADFENQGVMEFGISSSTAESLQVDKDMMAMFYVQVRHSGKIALLFGNMDNDSAENRLASLDKPESLWNPKDNAWDYDGGAADLETDPLRISFKVRKTREHGVYQAWGSISNLSNGATSETHTDTIEFELIEDAATLYDTPAALFAMGHSYRSQQEFGSSGTNRVSIINATVLGLDVAHTTGNPPVVTEPVLTEVVSADREVSFSWEPVLDATNGFSIVMETPSSETYVVASGLTDTTFTDGPRWNGIVNTYTLTADFGSGTTTSTNFSVAPFPMIGQEKMESSGWTTGGQVVGDLSGLTTNASFIYLDCLTTAVLTEGVGGYTGPTLYGLFQCAPAGTAFSVEAEANKAKFNGGSWGNWGNHLTFIKAEDMEAGVASYNAVDKKLAYSIRLGSWTWGEWDFACNAAIRNGSTWYLSATTLPRGGGGGEDKPFDIPDIMLEDWYEISVVPGLEIAVVGLLVDKSTLTDINAFGWFAEQMVNSALYDLEVKTEGDTPSYEYWTGSKGLVSSNSAPTLDPDGDGIINREEYAFDGDPLVADTAELPVITIDPASTGSDFVTCIYKKQRDPVGGLTYSLQSTTDLLTSWSPVAGATEGAIDYYWTAVTNQVPYSGAIDTEFYKVEVSGP